MAENISYAEIVKGHRITSNNDLVLDMQDSYKFGWGLGKLSNKNKKYIFFACIYLLISNPL